MWTAEVDPSTPLCPRPFMPRVDLLRRLFVADDAVFVRLVIRAAHQILAPFRDERYRHIAYYMRAYACMQTSRNREL